MLLFGWSFFLKIIFFTNGVAVGDLGENSAKILATAFSRREFLMVLGGGAGGVWGVGGGIPGKLPTNCPMAAITFLTHSGKMFATVFSPCNFSMLWGVGGPGSGALEGGDIHGKPPINRPMVAIIKLECHAVPNENVPCQFEACCAKSKLAFRFGMVRHALNWHGMAW